MEQKGADRGDQLEGQEQRSLLLSHVRPAAGGADSPRATSRTAGFTAAARRRLFLF